MDRTLGGGLGALVLLAGASAAQEPAPLDLPPVTVQAAPPAADASQEPAQGFRAEGTSALGPNLPLQQTPATVNVVTSDFLERSNARNLSDALVFVPGVATGDNGGTPAERFVVRGFEAAEFFNGLRQAVTTQQRRSLATIERVEIVKGPAGADLALPTFGGSVNIVTKKPQPAFATSLAASLGDYHYREAVADTTGPLNAARTLQYRLIGAYENGANWRPGRPDETPRFTLAPSLEWEYAQGGNVLLEYELIDSDEPLDRGIVHLRGAGFGNGFAPRDFSIHQKRDSMQVRSHRLDLDANHRLSELLSVRLRGQAYKEKVETRAFRNGATEGPPLYLDDGLTWSGLRDIPIDLDDSRGEARSWSLQGTLKAEIPAGPTRQTFLLGAGYNENDDEFLSREGDFRYLADDNTIDLFDPDNDQRVNVTGFEVFPDFLRGSQLKSVFGQWLAEWTPRWRTVLSARRDKLEEYTREDLPPSGYDAPPFEAENEDANPSYRIATSFDLLPNLTAFAGYSDAHEPQSGFTRDGDAVEALHGRSVELGLKATFAEGRLLWSNSVFQIDQDNITAPDPDNTDQEDFVILLGATRVRGVESELVGTVGEDLELGAGVALLDSEITESAQGFEGNRFPNTPRVQLSAFADYRWRALGLPGLTTQLGVVRVGGRKANSANEYHLPAYTRVDVGARYEVAPGLELVAAVENLFDDTYYTAAQDSGSGADQIGVGDRRLVQAGVRVRF
jgi:iron complex outermembrane recepter protein